MNKVKKAITGVGVAAGLLVGGVAFAAPANAVTTTYDYYPISANQCQVWAFVNYDWWEETFQGKRDQYFRLYTVNHRC